MIQKLTSFIKVNEGTGEIVNGRFMPYKCPAGKLTIAYGRNIEDNGVSEEEGDFMLLNDIRESEKLLADLFPEFDTFSEDRKIALIDMMYNLGYIKFSGFKKMIKAIHKKDWVEASLQAMDSKWYHQVKIRSRKVVEMLYKE